MVDWNDNNVKLIVYLIYGTSFLLMFLVLTLWKDKVSHIELMNDFKYLAGFGILHGLAEYSDIPRFLAWQPVWIYDIVKLLLVSGSFAALLAFGLNVISAGIEERRWIRGIPYGAFLMFVWLLVFAGLDFSNMDIGINYKTADLAQRYSMGLFGAILTSYAFFDLSRKMKIIAGNVAGNRFMYTGIGFALYAIFGGMIVNPLYGVPVVVYRSVIAVIITVTVIGTLRLFEVKNPKKVV